MEIRFKQAAIQNIRQSVERFTTLFEDRLSILRHAGHFYENLPNVQEDQFQAFCTSAMGDVPGIRAILLTDTTGQPTWIAPRDALPMPRFT